VVADHGPVRGAGQPRMGHRSGRLRGGHSRWFRCSRRRGIRHRAGSWRPDGSSRPAPGARCWSKSSRRRRRWTRRSRCGSRRRRCTGRPGEGGDDGGAVGEGVGLDLRGVPAAGVGVRIGADPGQRGRGVGDSGGHDQRDGGRGHPARPRHPRRRNAITSPNFSAAAAVAPCARRELFRVPPEFGYVERFGRRVRDRGAGAES
jgi:hypothetical protein